MRVRLLGYLRRPHPVREVAAFLGISRQAARKHVDQLLDGGWVTRLLHDDKTTVDYLLNTQTLVRLQLQLEGLCGLLQENPENDVQDASDETGRGPCMTVVRGHPVGKRYPLRSNRPLTIGRDPASIIAVPYDPYVSYRHAEIYRDNGNWHVMDLASDHGTRHNWIELPRRGQTVLKHGDVLGVGQTVMVFWSA